MVVQVLANNEQIEFHVETADTFKWFETYLWSEDYLSIVVDWQTVLDNDHTWDLENTTRITHGVEFVPPIVPHGLLSTVSLLPGPYEFEYQINGSKWVESTERWTPVVVDRGMIAYVPEPSAITYLISMLVLASSIILWKLTRK